MKHRNGFTLIELLVVIGLIAVLAGVLGLALGQGNSGAALQGSQATLQGIYASARGQAAIAQETAYVVVNVDPNTDGFLREFYIILADSNKPVGNAVTLSQGIYLVPKTLSTTFNGVVSFEGDWDEDRLSSAFANTNPQGYPGITGTFARVSGINERGNSAGTGKLILAPAERRDLASWVFNNPDAVRGVSISQYGVLTMLNDALSME